MTAARDANIVAGLRRRLATADAVTLTNLAWFAARRGLPVDALEIANRALLLRDPPAAARRAVERLTAGRTDGLLLVHPLDHFTPVPAASAPPPELVAPLRGESEIALLRQGRHFLERGRLPDALVIFDRVLLLHPSDPAALFHRGVVLAKLRRYGDALNDWELVGRADPTGRLGALSRRHARSARELASLFGAR